MQWKQLQRGVQLAGQVNRYSTYTGQHLWIQALWQTQRKHTKATSAGQGCLMAYSSLISSAARTPQSPWALHLKRHRRLAGSSVRAHCTATVCCAQHHYFCRRLRRVWSQKQLLERNCPIRCCLCCQLAEQGMHDQKQWLHAGLQALCVL